MAEGNLNETKSLSESTQEVIRGHHGYPPLASITSIPLTTSNELGFQDTEALACGVRPPGSQLHKLWKNYGYWAAFLIIVAVHNIFILKGGASSGPGSNLSLALVPASGDRTRRRWNMLEGGLKTASESTIRCINEEVRTQTPVTCLRLIDVLVLKIYHSFQD